MRSLKKIITPLITLLIFTTTAQAATFSDIATHRYKNAIESLANLGIIKGYNDSTFKPDQQINRAEFLKIVIGASSQNIGTSKNCFKDVTNEWFAPFICFAKKIGVVQGYSNGFFRPAQTVNYAEALKMLYLANADKGTPTTNQAWYAAYYENARKNNITLSNITELHHLLTRGEAAQLIWNYRLKKKSGSGTSSSGSGTSSSGSGTSSSGSGTSSSGSGTSSSGSGTSSSGSGTSSSGSGTSSSGSGTSSSGSGTSSSGSGTSSSGSGTSSSGSGTSSSGSGTSSSGSGTSSSGSGTSSSGSGTSSSGSAGISTCNEPISGHALYVSLTGNDSTGDGTLSNPYRTIAKALAQSAPGDTIAIKNGTYQETNTVRVRNPNITIRSVPGEWAIIDRSAYPDDIAVYFDVDSSGSKLQCVEVIGGLYAFSTETRWDWGGTDRSGASNLIVEDSKLHDSYRDVIKIKPGSDNITIRRNEIYNSGKGLARGDCNAEGIDNVNGDNLLVQNNYIHDICSNGIYCKGGAQNCVIENNRVINTGSAGILVGFDTSPEYFDLTVNPHYYENINGIVRNNLVMDTQGAGIGLFASKDAQVYNNTIINTASQYHSPIYFGISFQDWDDSAERPANINPTIKNNVIVQKTGHNTSTIDIRYSNELGGLSALSGSPNMSGNCYYHEGSAASFNDNRPGNILTNGTLAQWQNHINADTDSIEANPALDSQYKATGACAGKGFMP